MNHKSQTNNLPLVVYIVEVLSDPGFWALALDVGGGTCGGGVAGRSAAESGQSGAAPRCHCTEDKHGESIRSQFTM